MLEACDGASDRVEAAFDFLEPVVDRLNVPRRIADGVRRIVAMMPRLQTGRPGRFARTPLYEYAAEVVELSAKARGASVKPNRDASPKRKRRR